MTVRRRKQGPSSPRRSDPDDGSGSLTPEQAVDRLEHLHSAGSNALREALARYTESGIVPTAQERGAVPLPRALRRLATVRRRALHPSRLGEVPVARSLFDDRDAARLLSPIPARSVASAGRRIRRSHRGQDQRAGDSLSLRHRGRRRVRARRSLGGRSGAPFPDARAGQCRRRGGRRHLAARRRRRRGRSPCSTPCASISRCAGSSTTPAPTAARPALDPVHQLPALRRRVRAPGRCAELHRPGGAYSQLALPGGAIVRRGDEPAAVDAAIAARRGIASRCRPTI